MRPNEWGATRVSDDAVAEAIDALRRLPTTRMVMECARRLGVPYSLARVLWEDPEDLAMEFAFDAVEAMEHYERCPKCGTKAEDIVDENGRRLELGRWKHELFGCTLCQDRHREERQMSDHEKENAAFRTLPRQFGEPYVDR